MAAIKLLDNVSANTIGDAKKGDGGGRVLTVFGTLGGGTVTLEVSDLDQTNWVPVTLNGTPVAVVTPIALYIRKISQGQYIRASLAGSSGASGVFVVITN